MDALYAAAYPQLYAGHWWWRAREDMLLRKIRRLLSNVPDARILDVGCGAAMFFDALEPFGHVEGIESDRTAAERSGRWRGRIVVGDLDETYSPTAPFDLILMLDVLSTSTIPNASWPERGNPQTQRPRPRHRSGVHGYGRRDEGTTTSVDTRPAHCATSSPAPAWSHSKAICFTANLPKLRPR